MKNHYELVFVVTPVLSDNQVRDAVGKFMHFIKKNGGKIVHKENWGLKKIAYTIKKKNMGFYQLIQFEAPGELLAKLEISLKHDERILRHIIVKLDKYAYAYAEKRKNKLLATTEPT